jgi:hypothetical protein
MRDNKEAFSELARDACELVYAANHHNNDPTERLPQFQVDVAGLTVLSYRILTWKRSQPILISTEYS